MEIRDIQPCEWPAIFDVYRRSCAGVYPLFRDPARIFRTFATGASSGSWSAWVALDGRRMVGFVLVAPGSLPGQGALLTLVVDPASRRSGIGGSLLHCAEDNASRKGWTELRISSDMPGYCCLGIPLHSGEYQFFARHGYSEVGDTHYRPIWMQVDMAGWQCPPKGESLHTSLAAQGIEVRISTPADQAALASMTSARFAGWFREYFDPAVQSTPPAPSSIAIQGGRVLAFTGPLAVDAGGYGSLGAVGVDPDFRRLGLGRSVFHSACAWWQTHGAQRGYLWTATNMPAVHIYEEAGLRIMETYAAMARPLSVAGSHAPGVAG